MKYYVKSKQLEVVIGGAHINTPEEAAIEAVLRHCGEKILSPNMVVSERGFNFFNHDEGDVFLITKDILKKAGFLT